MMLGTGINKESFVSKVFIAPSNRSPFRKIYMYHIIEEEKQINISRVEKLKSKTRVSILVNSGQL